MNCLLIYIILLILLILYLHFKCSFANQEYDPYRNLPYPSGRMPGSAMLVK